MTDASFNLLDLVDDRIDDLDTALQPLLSQTILDHANKLPVADKARLYVLTTYAIESLLFSYLRLTGVSAKSHPVMSELTRVRQYVSKIKSATPAVQVQPMVLDTAAANRFIKAALAGNEQYDAERAEREARERAGAEAKLAALGPPKEEVGEVIVVRQPEEKEEEKVLEVIDGEGEGGERKRKGGGRKRPKWSKEKEKRRAERKEARKDVRKSKAAAT
ncbi:hypothetical protein BDD12DRAFT_844283 [Trichophaea hybrida]|nr:hypothetical protein BDD12DRAFT_844283 [Trichophaea hybrida]